MLRMKAILLFSAAVAFVTAPLLVPSFGGFNPAAFPYPPIDPPVQPAGYAFGIWGLLYVWLLAHACFGLLKRADHPAWDGPRWPLFASLGLGAIWLETAVTMPVVAVVLIWVMTAAAVMALLRTPAAPDRWLLRAPIAAYAGWLTAAAGVGTGVALTGYGIWSPVAVALAMLALILGLAMAVQLRSQAPEYGAAVLWALIGVLAANLTSAPVVAIAALVGGGIVAAAVWATISRAQTGVGARG
ncbi:hypothetical protein GVY41_03835 [Frigidibacter albus]|uniref:Uncharacterized protein n=2 Tax=Frigidibacter albus TaxID=1465486 RepID=A0A6L8VEL5_9RHOB|nr:hypothetical protein [Frigidibacter albus]MZQ88191.1 hypothetical protein [Frigidibacter albus]NBE30135.1 hypothetical protein [Frigidibacter albus]